MTKSRIYRLRPCNENTLDELTNNYFWFSKPTEFNDSEDANIISFAEENVNIKDVLEKRFQNLNVIKEFAENVGICCFTKELPCSSSWGNFPRCRNGIALEYDKVCLEKYFVTVLGDCFKNVDYFENPTIFKSSTPYDILWEEYDDGDKLYKSLASINSDIRDMDKFFLMMLTRINLKYKKQKEQRIIVNPSLAKTNGEVLSKGYKVKYPKDAILRIHYKANISKAYLEKLKKIGIELIER